MHAIFFPYGKIEWVDIFLNDVKAQKFQMTMTNGKKTQKIWIQSQLRRLPFGFYEVIFPREYKEAVLTTLEFHEKDLPIDGVKRSRTLQRYGVGFLKQAMLRKMFGAKNPGEFDSSKHLLWTKGIASDQKDVHIIPVGIREDGDLIETLPAYKGWKHEAI